MDPNFPALTISSVAKPCQLEFPFQVPCHHIGSGHAMWWLGAPNKPQSLQPWKPDQQPPWWIAGRPCAQVPSSSSRCEPTRCLGLPHIAPAAGLLKPWLPQLPLMMYFNTMRWHFTHLCIDDVIFIQFSLLLLFQAHFIPLCPLATLQLPRLLLPFSLLQLARTI